MSALLQNDSRQRMIELHDRPSDHPVWGGPGWKVYLDSCTDVERTVRYVRDNPGKAGRPEQTWDFVLEYDGWLPGVGARKK